jgi:hypothetical protein
MGGGCLEARFWQRASAIARSKTGEIVIGSGEGMSNIVTRRVASRGVAARFFDRLIDRAVCSIGAANGLGPYIVIALPVVGGLIGVSPNFHRLSNPMLMESGKKKACRVQRSTGVIPMSVQTKQVHLCSRDWGISYSDWIDFCVNLFHTAIAAIGFATVLAYVLCRHHTMVVD